MKRKITLQEVLNGDFLTRAWFKKQYRLILLICGLIFLYILSDFSAQRQHNRLTQTEKELQDARFVYQTLHATLVEQTRQSSVAATLKERGSNIQENTRPVTRIE